MYKLLLLISIFFISAVDMKKAVKHGIIETQMQLENLIDYSKNTKQKTCVEKQLKDFMHKKETFNKLKEPTLNEILETMRYGKENLKQANGCFTFDDFLNKWASEIEKETVLLSK